MTPYVLCLLETLRRGLTPNEFAAATDKLIDGLKKHNRIPHDHLD
jgi:hypothetical protein